MNTQSGRISLRVIVCLVTAEFAILPAWFGVRAELPQDAKGQTKAKPEQALRVALVSQEKGDALRAVLALAEARLGQTPGVALVERQTIDRVLAEQKLSLSGLVATEQALTLGKLLAVDLFAVLEAGPNKKEAAGLVIFDAGTGVRFWDASLPLEGIDRSVAAIEEAVRSAQQKRRTVAKLRPVCLLAVRNADLPRGLDAFCDSVGAVLERRLLASPTLAVLERRRLEQVNKERNLPVDSPLRQMLASVVTVDLEISSRPGGKGLRAVATLTDGQGKPLGKASAAVDRQDEVSLSQALHRDLLRALNVRAAPARDGEVQEAKRFLRESDFYFEHRDVERSLRAAETACALQPEDPVYRAVLARGLLMQATHILYPPPARGVSNPRVDPETLERALAPALRGSEILANAESLPLDPRRERVFAWKMALFHAEGSLGDFLPRVSIIRRTLTAAERDALDGIRANRSRCDAIRLERFRQAVKDHPTFTKYTDKLNKVLGMNKGDRFLPPARWTDLLCGLRHWAELARQYEDDRAGWSQLLLWTAVDGYGPPRPHTPEEIARLRQFWADLEKHPNTILAAHGKLGSLVNDLSYASPSEAEARRRVRDYRLGLQKVLENEAGVSPGTRIGLYLTATDALSNNAALKLPGRFEELKELSEFMLRRGEVCGPLVLANASLFANGFVVPRNQAYAHEFLGRTLALLDGKEGKFLAAAEGAAEARAERALFRSAVQQLQARIRQLNPTLGKAAAPWEKATPLINVFPGQKGIVWLQQPVVHQETVCLAAVRVEDRPRRYTTQLLQLPLAGGRRLEGRPIAVDIRLAPGNRPGSGRNLHFGSSACLAAGRYFLGTFEYGIFAFPLDGGIPERISTASGLPSDHVQALACLDGRLYAFLGKGNTEGYLVVWDLKKRQCDVLASSRRKEKRSPFDDAIPAHALALLADPARSACCWWRFSP